MHSYNVLNCLIVVLTSLLTAGRAQIPRELVDFGYPFLNPPEITRTPAQLEAANLRKESAQAFTIDASIKEELEQSNEPVIRTFLDETGNNHTEIYTKNDNGTITKKQTGFISLDDLSKNGNVIPGVGKVPIDLILQGSGVVTIVSKDEDVQQHKVFRLQFKPADTMDGNTPLSTSEEITPTTTTRTTTTTPTPTMTSTTTTVREPTSIADSIFSKLNRIFDSYRVKTEGENTYKSFRPTLLSRQEFFARPSSNVFNPASFNLFDLNEEQQTQEPNKQTKEIRIASDGKTIVTVCIWPALRNSILTRSPFTETTVRTRAGSHLVTRASQLLNANQVTIYATDDLTVGRFYSWL